MRPEDDLSRELRWLADIERIKQLKARYAAACDDGYDPDRLAELFTEDAVWDGGFMGRAETRDGIRAFFANASTQVGFAVHGLSNPIIEVKGDHATGQWYLFQPMTLKDTDRAFWFCARYEDEYVRTGEGWKIRHTRVIARAFSPYELGFARQLVADPRA